MRSTIGGNVSAGAHEIDTEFSPTLSTVPRTSSATFLGRGLYDLPEISRLVCAPVATVEGWTRPTSRRPRLLEAELDPLYSFYDLLTAKLIRELSQRGVPLGEIATGIDYLQQSTGSDRPFAHQEMATSGRNWFNKRGDQTVDVGKGGQLAWGDAVSPTLRSLSYGQGGMATVWRPMPRIWINPDVQAGASCIDESRTTTRLIWDLVEAGNSPADIAWQLELDDEDVLAAETFERRLSERRPADLLPR
jgi:uncharacterized protein (DUF433 family)